MKWTVLVDNRTNDPVLETEHGLSIFLETEVLWLSSTSLRRVYHPIAHLQGYT